MDYAMRIIKSLKEFGLLISSVTETIENEEKKQRRFLDKLLGILGASLLGNLLTGKGVKQSNIQVQRVMPAGEGTIRAGQYFKCCLIP